MKTVPARDESGDSGDSGDVCPCKYTTPCHERCTCVMPMSSSGCRRCYTYGSANQRTARAQLVRIITWPDPAVSVYRRHPHEGMIICIDHLREITVDIEPTFVDLPADQAAFWGQKCLMCGVTPAPGHQCQHEDCNKPLHPMWPAIYCCNDCAMRDV